MFFSMKPIRILLTSLFLVMLPSALQAAPDAPTTFFDVGTTLVYENIQPNLRHQERLELKILATWPGGLTWHYTYYDRDAVSGEGIDTLPYLDTCRSVASWEIPEEPIDSSCDFWFSPDQLRALKANNLAFIVTTRDYERPKEVRITDPQRVSYTLMVDGREVTVHAIEATKISESRLRYMQRTGQTSFPSQKLPDTYIILDDERFPLILSSADGNFKLTRIIHAN